MTIAINIGSQSLLDAARDVLISDLAAVCAEFGALVSDFSVSSPKLRNLLIAEPRIPGQGSSIVALACAFRDSDDNLVAGRKMELWALRVAAIHHEQRFTGGATPQAATQENESWRIAHSLVRCCEVALVRGLTSRTGIYHVKKASQDQQPATDNPAQYQVDVTLDVWMEVYDPLFMSAPT